MTKIGPTGSGNSHRGQEHKYELDVLIVARKGNDMEEKMREMIRQKNRMLMDGAHRLHEISRIASGLENANDEMHRETAIQLCRLAGSKLQALSISWFHMEDEGMIAPPGAEQGAEDVG